MTYKNKVNIVLLVFVLNISNSFAGKEFNITPVGQDKSLWCWAAVSEMVCAAYQTHLTMFKYPTPVDQYDIAQWAVGGHHDVTNVLSGTSKSIEGILYEFGRINCNYTKKPDGFGQGTITRYQYSDEILGGKPVIANVVIDDGADVYKHIVLMIGFTGTAGYNLGNVVYNDPDEGGGSRQEKSFSDFEYTLDKSWGWFETLRLTSYPSTAIPIVGIGQQHRVILLTDFCTKEITQSPQSLSYRAYKNGDQPISWEWKLVFPHSGGEVIVASWNTTTSQRDLTWNIPNFTMPSNYDWYYNYNGTIGGTVQVECMDPDYHFEAMNVSYVPSNLFPGVLIYEDMVINNSQPDVRAHELLIIRNDHFTIGGNISLKSGGLIVVEDGVTIDNGSVTNFIVEPALR